MMKKIKFLFETKMYLISIIPLLFLIFIDNVAHYGYNKSVGWAFEINGISYYSINFFISFIIGFLFLAFIKVKTNFILSFLFFLSFVFFCLIQDVNIQIVFTDKVLLFITSLFLLIFIYSIYLKFKK